MASLIAGTVWAICWALTSSKPVKSDSTVFSITLDMPTRYNSTFISVQAVFITHPTVSENGVYDFAMHPGGRPTSKPRSTLGQRIIDARERAGISQAQLADKLGTSQPAIAYWERRATNLRSDVIAKLSQILGVSADELLGTQPTRQKKAVQPLGKARQVFDRVSKLPRRQQQKVIEMAEGFLSLHEAPTGTTTPH